MHRFFILLKIVWKTFYQILTHLGELLNKVKFYNAQF